MSVPDPLCGAPEAPVAETRGRALDHSVGMSEDLSWRRPVAVTSCSSLFELRQNCQFVFHALLDREPM